MTPTTIDITITEVLAWLILGKKENINGKTVGAHIRACTDHLLVFREGFVDRLIPDCEKSLTISFERPKIKIGNKMHQPTQYITNEKR